MGMQQYVSLVNSIYCADNSRIALYLKGEGQIMLGKERIVKDEIGSASTKIDSIPSGHILVCKVFYPGPQLITIEQKKDANKQTKTWHVMDPGLILPEYLVEFEYSTSLEEKKENTVNLETKMLKNKEVARIFSATIEASKILQNTYLNPQVKEGLKATTFHIVAEDLDRSDMGCMKNQLLAYLKS